MNTKDMLLIAFRNLNAGKEMVRKMIFGMMLVVMLVCCFLTVLHSFFTYTAELNQRHAADCYYYTELGRQEITETAINTLLEQGRTVREQYEAAESAVLCALGLRDTEKSLEAGNTALVLGGETYEAVNYFLYSRTMYQNIQWKSSPLPFALYRDGMSVFADKITAAYGEGYLLGDYPKNAGEIMLDTYLLEVYGVDVDEGLLGSTVSLYCRDGETEETVLKDYTLTGIFQSGLLAYRESVLTADSHLEHIYVNLRPEDEARFEISQGSIRYYFNNYTEYVRHYDHMNSILQLKVSEVYESDSTQMRLTGKGMEYCLLYWIMDHIGKLLLLVGVLTGLIITFSVFYVFQFYRDRNARYFLMLQNIGMEKKDRRGIFSIELSVMILTATVFGVYLSVIVLLFFSSLTRQVLDFNVVLNAETGFAAIIICWIYFWTCLQIAMKGE